MNKKVLMNVIEGLGGKFPVEVVNAISLVIEKGVEAHKDILSSCLRHPNPDTVTQVITMVLRSDPDNASVFVEQIFERSRDLLLGTQKFSEASILGLFEARCINGWQPNNLFVTDFPDYVYRIVVNMLHIEHNSKYERRLEGAVKNWVHRHSVEAKSAMIRLANHYETGANPSGVGLIISDAIAFKTFSSMDPNRRMIAVATYGY